MSDPIDYHQLMQAALRDVVRRTLAVVAEQGLPAGHFFYVTFVTRAPGVDVPEALAVQYPDEMTVILQHQYWNLEVGDEEFSVGLSFSAVPYTITVPFSAVVSFVDPPSEFGLRFAPPPGFEVEEVKRPRADDGEPVPMPAAEPSPEDGGRVERPKRGKVVSLDDFRKR
jgi:hypothetical protein